MTLLSDTERDPIPYLAPWLAERYARLPNYPFSGRYGALWGTSQCRVAFGAGFASALAQLMVSGVAFPSRSRGNSAPRRRLAIDVLSLGC